jgi:hypothetical protein
MLRMVLSPIQWAGLGLACIMFTSPAGAAAAPGDGHSSSAPANADSAADGAAPVRDPRIKSERTGDLQSPRTGAEVSAGSKARNSAAVAPRRAFETPQRGIHQGASSRADRVHSPMNTQARGRLARQTSRPSGSNRASSGGPALRRPGSVGSASAPTLGASKRNVLPLPKLTTAPRNSAIGRSRVQSVGLLGGAGVGRTNHSVAIDGTQFRRKF